MLALGMARAVRWLGAEFLPALLPVPDLNQLRRMFHMWPVDGDPSVLHSVAEGKTNASRIASKQWKDTRSYLFGFAPADLQSPGWRFNDFAKYPETSELGFLLSTPNDFLIDVDGLPWLGAEWLRVLVKYFTDDIRYDVQLQSSNTKDLLFAFEPISVLSTPWSVIGWMILRRVTDASDVAICPNPTCRELFVKKRSHAATCPKPGCRSWDYRRRKKESTNEEGGN